MTSLTSHIEVPTTTQTKESGGELTLTADQQAALEDFFSFLCNKEEQVWVLKGFSGCGKSTLIRTVIDQLPAYMKTARLIDPTFQHYDIKLTATTNKAAENLAFITGMDVSTIHSALGIRPVTDYSTGETRLVPRSKDPVLLYTILFIDEASYIDSQLLGLIFKMVSHCKVVFIGDPAQLAPVKSTGVPVFEAKFPTSMLSQVVRQAEGNPIVDLSTQFRKIVEHGDWSTFSFKPDGHHVIHMDRDAFNNAVASEFTRPDWRYRDSKVLAWTNKRVIEYNHFIRNLAKGDPQFQVEDYAVCNSFVTNPKAKFSLKTDQLVQIDSISAETEELGVIGRWFGVDGGAPFFMPNSLKAKADRFNEAKALKDEGTMFVIDQHWIDLRAAYAQTINKAQGSTYDRVFIDLDDVRRANTGDAIARMLYVGVSRARHQVFLTGDLA